MRQLDSIQAREYVADAYEQFRETGNLEETAELFGFNPKTLMKLFERMAGEGENQAEFTIYMLDRGSANIVVIGGY